MKYSTVAFAVAGSLMTSGYALACETDQMSTTDVGFIHKVVGLSDKIEAYDGPDDGGTVAFGLGLLQPYFVICEDGEFFHVTDIRADTVEQALTGRTGYVLKSQVALWPTREALAFSKIAFVEERPEIVAWGDENTLEKFMATGNMKLHSPAFKEDLDSTLKRERSTRPYPVLDSTMHNLRGIKEKRVFNVLLPAALSEDARIEFAEDEVETIENVLQDATIVLVFDATGSMAEFAADVAAELISAFNSLDREVRERAKVGFVFFRDLEDDERMTDMETMPIDEASQALKRLATPVFMDGGGDVAEPILDAVYYTATQFDWGSGSQGAGKRVIVGVLNGDAKPTTIGGIAPDGKVPTGLDAQSVAELVAGKSIDVMTVQAGPDKGPNFDEVMITLGGAANFIEWETKDRRRDIALKMSRAMTSSAEEAIAKGKEAVDRMKIVPASLLGAEKSGLTAYATIPLEVLDAEMLERLRRNGVEFNIDPGVGGVLVREGYIMENDDLLFPEIQIEKETLQNLINLYAVLATAGMDPEGFRVSVAEAIAAIAGEDYDPTEPIQSIIEKKLGIKFPSKLLSFDLEFLDAMSSGERLEFAGRVQDAGEKLGDYLDANLIEFDRNPAVYMPVSALP